MSESISNPRVDEDLAEYDGSYDRHTLKGQIVFNTLDEKHYRILYLPEDREVQTGYWICVDSDSNVPRGFKVSELEERLSANIYRTVYDKYFVSMAENLSEANRQRMERNYALIEKLIAREPEIYDRKLRSGLLRELKSEDSPSFENLYNYLGRYWRGGMTKAALMPNYAKNGTYRKADYVPAQKLGRPGKAGNRGKVLSPEDLQNFADIIEKLYLTDRQPKLSEVYSNLLSQCYDSVEEPDGSVRKLRPEEKPSYMQFYYWYKKNRDVVQEALKRKGESKFRLQNRGIPGHSESQVQGPGLAMQIDATIADYYLVKADDRNALVGRPVVFFVRDVWSRMITGMYVTLENSSWDCALMALKNVAEDKVEFCRRYGVEITPEDWPCHHLPNLIVGDNGEMGDKGVEDKIRKLGITIQNTPPYRGDLKAIIENAFNLINLRLHYIAPGHVEKDADTRGAIDRRKEACIDLNTFIRMMIHCVLYYNRSWYMKTYHKTPQMREHKVKPVPRELWNYGLQYLTGAMQVLEPDEIKKVLLPKTQVPVTEKGIYFKGLYYTCEQAEQEQWLARARIKRFKLTVLYDPTCVDDLYILDSQDRLQTCYLIDKSALYSGASVEDTVRFHEQDLQEQAQWSETEEQAKSSLIQTLNGIVNGCRKEKQEGSKAAVAAKLNRLKITENRQAEISQLSGQTEALNEQQAYLSKSLQPDETGDESEEFHKTAEDAISKSIDDVLRKAGIQMV